MPRTSSSDDAIYRDTSTLIGTIALASITTTDRPIKQENFTTLTSYDFIPGEKGTIAVPGCPPIWSPPEIPATVPQDSGAYNSDPARSIFPHCPMEPFFRAVAITKPKFDLSAIDIISDRRNLRLLRSFIDPETGKSDVEVKNKAKAFRIDMEVVGKTVMFFSWHEEEMDVVKTFRGYGREFEKVFTKAAKELRGSIWHHRAVTYTLAGLKMVVRFKVEGYIPGHPPIPGNRERYKGPPYKTMKAINPKSTPTGYNIQIKGKFVPSSQLLEIKTGRLKGDKKDLEERSVDQMWFSRTRVLCAGHWEKDKGFTSVKEIDMLEGGQLDAWAANKESTLRGLVRVLEMLAEVVRKKEGRYALVREYFSNELKILEIKTECPGGVPEDIKEGWGRSQG